MARWNNVKPLGNGRCKTNDRRRRCVQSHPCTSASLHVKAPAGGKRQKKKRRRMHVLTGCVQLPKACSVWRTLLSHFEGPYMLQKRKEKKKTSRGMIGRCNGVWQECAGIDSPWVGCARAIENGAAARRFFDCGKPLALTALAEERAEGDGPEWFLKKKRRMKSVCVCAYESIQWSEKSGLGREAQQTEAGLLSVRRQGGRHGERGKTKSV